MPPLTDQQNSGNSAGNTETTSDGDQNPTNPTTQEPDPPTHPDLPPESFWVSASDELDWLDRNTFIQRKGSVKFAITKTSNRSFSFNNNKPKASIIGPPKSQKFNPAAGNNKSRQVENRKLFRSRSESAKDRVYQLCDPVSPSVSCMGRVGTRNRCSSRKKYGFWATVRAAFVSRVKQERCLVNKPVEPVAAKSPSESALSR